jgi:methionine aminopeptidase
MSVGPCLLAAQILDHAESIIKPGITTDFIDRAAGSYTRPLFSST